MGGQQTAKSKQAIGGQCDFLYDACTIDPSQCGAWIDCFRGGGGGGGGGPGGGGGGDCVGECSWCTPGCQHYLMHGAAWCDTVINPPYCELDAEGCDTICEHHP